MAFSDVLGNNRVKNILGRALRRERMPNSLLFTGPEGVGKKETALVIAKALNCLNKNDDACETCSVCTAINNGVEEGQFPDVMLLSPENDVLKIEQIRLLKQTAYLKPMSGKKRVFILDPAEKMNEESANSLLKILEEPPLFSHLILITSNPFLLLPTVKSRCQILNFSPISQEDIEKELVQKGCLEEQARVLSLLARGNLKMALDLDWQEVKEKKEKAWSFILSLFEKKDRSDVLKSLLMKPKKMAENELSEVLEIGALFCRDIILIAEKGKDRLLMNPDYTESLYKVAEKVNILKVHEILYGIDHMLYGMTKNANLNLLVSSSFLKLMEKKYV